MRILLTGRLKQTHRSRDLARHRRIRMKTTRPTESRERVFLVGVGLKRPAHVTGVEAGEAGAGVAGANLRNWPASAARMSPMHLSDAR